MASRASGQEGLAGAELGRYHLVEKIGRGGMGEVYRARDQHLSRDVAIKVLRPGTLIDESARKHFHKEALILSQLNHPNIATIHDFDTQQGVDFLVMEFIPGVSLSEQLAAGPLPEKEILRLGVQLAEGLSAAHEHAVVHRDLKPGNLRVTGDGWLKILDFGLAKLLLPVPGSVATESATETQSTPGTVPYMAPEQLLGEAIDARTDVHAAGAVLYEMAAGRRPFAQVERLQLVGAILHKSPSPPSTLHSGVSAELDRIIGKCLEKAPENRYQSAKELGVDLRRLQSGASASQVLPEPRRRHTRNLVIAAVLFALLAIGGTALYRGLQNRDAAVVPVSVTPSIAVLPFVDLSPEKDQEYFSDGLAEELLNDLAKIPNLRVTARTSSFQFKGKNEDLRSIAQKLNVAAILEGSVRKEGRRVRITAQLINAADGFHLWSETYDRELNDVFAVQDDISRSVAASLKVELLRGKASSPRPASEEAYSAYLQGQYFYQRRGEENWEKAVDYYEKAVKLDSSYASAWAGLARAHARQGDFGYLPVVEAYRKAREEVERALALDANLAEAHAIMGWIRQIYDWDWIGADASYQRALALEPGNARALEGAAGLANTLGRFEQALKLQSRAVELDPLDTTSRGEFATYAFWAGHLEEATAAYKKALELDPECPTVHTYLGQIYLQQSRPQAALDEVEREPDPRWRLFGLALTYHALGREKESDAALRELTANHAETSATQIAEVYAVRGEADRAFEWLERAYAQRDGGLCFLLGDSMLKNLEHDPRYAAFLKKMRLPS